MSFFPFIHIHYDDIQLVANGFTICDAAQSAKLNQMTTFS